MRKIIFAIAVCSLFFIACDPKIDQREARYNPAECPVCPSLKGKCRTCRGTGECSFCDGKGTRTTSTKNYTGEGINLIDYKEDCPFCRKTGVCSHCEGNKLCFACEGTQKVDTNWNFLVK